MAIEYASEARWVPSRRDGMRIRLRIIAFVVPAAALIGGVLGTLVAPQAGLLAAAFVLGWTQLVGL